MTQIDFTSARRAMIDSQLRTSGVNEDFVLARMNAVPREDHVPSEARAGAYSDRAVPLGDGCFLAAPLVYGRMLAEARPQLDDRVLIIDGGSNYLPALLDPLVGNVTVVAAKDFANNRKIGSDFSLVVVDGAVEQLPATLEKALIEGGRIVTGLIERGVTRLAIGRRAGGSVGLLPLAELGIPRLAVFDRPKAWSF